MTQVLVNAEALEEFIQYAHSQAQMIAVEFGTDPCERETVMTGFRLRVLPIGYERDWAARPPTQAEVNASKGKLPGDPAYIPTAVLARNNGDVSEFSEDD